MENCKFLTRVVIFLSILILPFFLESSQATAQYFNFGSPYGRRETVREPVSDPEYKGGVEKLNQFLLKNFKRPDTEERPTGQIVIACLLNKKGKVSETTIVQGVNKLYDAEAVRVVKKLKFKPAKQGKKTVESRYDIGFPIRKGRFTFSTLKTIDI